MNVYILSTTQHIRAVSATHCSMGLANLPIGRPWTGESLLNCCCVKPATLLRDESEQDADAPKGAQDDEQKEEGDYVPIQNSCAYEKQAADGDDLPLQTFCACTHEEQPPWRTCKHKGCSNNFHDRCCVTTSFAYGLRNTKLTSKTMFCPEHNKELQAKHLKQQIQIKYMTKDREKYLAKQAEEDLTLVNVQMSVLGIIADVSLTSLVGSIPVSEGGFAQRNVASQHASIIEQSIRKDGYLLLAGNLALAEIPFSQDEVDELIQNKLLPDDFVPPKPLRDMQREHQGQRLGAWIMQWDNLELRMRDRRFAIIDGNNRVIAIVRILAEDIDFLKDTPLNAYLVDLPIHDGLAVQLASMKCNRLSHQNIEDTIGDVIQQYQNVVRVFEKLQTPNFGKAKDKISTIVKWITNNVEELTPLLPPGVQDKKGNLKKEALTARIRLAKKASPELAKWIQNKFALHHSEKENMSRGLVRMLSHHHLKMDAVWEHSDPQAYIEARGRQLELGINLQTASKKWKPERRQLLTEFMGYGDEQMRCAAEVMKASPDLCDILQSQLQVLATEHQEDNELRALIPIPITDHPDHRLVKALTKLQEGGCDFDIYCELWVNSKQAAAPSRDKARRVYPTYDKFDISNMPRAVQEAYSELCVAMSKVQNERARAKAEAEREAAIKERQEAAKKAAEEQLERDKEEAIEKAKQQALAKRAADAAVAEATEGKRATHSTKPVDPAAVEKAVAAAEAVEKQVPFFFFFVFF